MNNSDAVTVGTQYNQYCNQACDELVIILKHKIFLKRERERERARVRLGWVVVVRQKIAFGLFY